MEDVAQLTEDVAEIIANSKRVVVFTGAGISTESGLPDFRGPQGLWTKFNPDDFTYQKYLSDREPTRKTWLLHYTTTASWTTAQPSPAHYAVAELERLDKLDCIITQNV